MTGVNPFEQAHRNHKANALLFVIAADHEKRGIKSGSIEALRDVEQATDATWFRWWTEAKCASAPSDATKALVVAAVRMSAECGAEIEKAGKTLSPLQLFKSPKTFLPGEGSLIPIETAERVRLGMIEMCEPCNGTGVRERYFTDEGIAEDPCSACEGRGAVDGEGAAIPVLEPVLVEPKSEGEVQF